MNRRDTLKSMLGAMAAAAGVVGLAPAVRAQTKHIRLYVEMDVDPAREREMLDLFHSQFVPEAVKHDGYMRVKLLKRRTILQGRRRPATTTGSSSSSRAKSCVSAGLPRQAISACGRRSSASSRPRAAIPSCCTTRCSSALRRLPSRRQTPCPTKTRPNEHHCHEEESPRRHRINPAARCRCRSQPGRNPGTAARAGPGEHGPAHRPWSRRRAGVP